MSTRNQDGSSLFRLQQKQQEVVNTLIEIVLHAHRPGSFEGIDEEVLRSEMTAHTAKKVADVANMALAVGMAATSPVIPFSDLSTVIVPSESGKN